MSSPNQHQYHHYQPQQQSQPPPAFDMHQFFMPHHQPPPPPPQQQQQQPPPPSSSYPPPTGPHFSPYLNTNPNPNPNFSNMHPQRSLSFPTPPLQPPPSPYSDRSGAEIMALLRPSSSPSPTPPLQTSPHDYPSLLPVGLVRMQSGKMPRGRRVSGEHAVYDTDVRLQGEAQPQLEVTPITKYNSDPQLCLGRQIAVNKNYICYGLKQGTVRILNINTALRSLFRTQSQRVTDMVFFAEDVHLLASAGIDGRINVWKISEEPDEEDKPQITGKTVTSVQIVGEEEIRNPRVCWHCYKQEILVVGVGKRVLKIDTTKVGKAESYSPEAPLQCSVDKLVDGIQIVGKHDGEVTDLSMCQWMTTRLVSASMDGTIKIWEDIKALPLAVLIPHDGQPVYSSTFLTAPNRPDHIILMTAGSQNREVKIWTSTREEGWLLPGDSETLNCTQTLELKSSAEPGVEEAFFNQVLALSQVGILLLANAKRNAIYAIHLEYGSNPSLTRMDYISEFTVTMPILSLTGTSDMVHGQSVAQIYCVQTQAIQQYTLDLCQCLPPPLENVGLEKSNSSVSLSQDVASTEGFIASDSRGSRSSDVPLSSASTDAEPLHDVPSANMDSKTLSLVPSTSKASSNGFPASPLPLRPGLSRDVTEIAVEARHESASPSNGPGLSRPDIDYSVNQETDTSRASLNDIRSLDNDSRIDEKKVARDDNSNTLSTSGTFKHPTHLITPSEILMAVSSSEINNYNEPRNLVDMNVQDVIVNSDVSNAELEVKEVGETQPIENGDFLFQGDLKKIVPENREKIFCSQATSLGIEMTREYAAISTESHNAEERWQDGDTVQEFLAQSSHVGEEEVHQSADDMSGKVSESAVSNNLSHSTTPTLNTKRQKGKTSQINSSDSSSEPVGASGLPSEVAAFRQILAMQEMLNQLLTNQKEMQKQMSNVVAVPVSKECRKLEAALGRNIEKAVKANSDALWAHFEEENAKNEKLIRDRTQQITSLISNFINKEFASSLEKSLKKELSSVAQSVARTISPVVEKVITSSIAESFQRGVGDKAVNQLEKSVNLKLEATVARQIQAQFQTSGKQALQDGLKSGLEVSVLPAFERSCKVMFEQVDTAFRKGMLEHTASAQQHFESANSSLALTLRETINSASSLTRTLSEELAENQQKLLALVAAGANSGAAKPVVTQSNNGILSGLFEKVKMPVDPAKEISRLLSECKFEEAFTMALQRSDVSIVSWLCSQVDLRGILSIVPLPLSQGVLLSLLQQLSCDISKDTSRKLSWMTDVAAALNPSDQMIAVHAHRILEQVYQILQYQQSSPSRTGAEISSIRVLMHVVNSLIRTCK